MLKSVRTSPSCRSSNTVRVALIASASLLAYWGCKSDEKFPDIGETLAAPVDVAVADDDQHFFVLNADFDRTYHQGSIVVLDKEGNKVGKVDTPRMGRTMTVAGNDMLVTFDARDDDDSPLVQLYDVSTATSPTLKAQWDLACSPFGATMIKGYDDFVISCMGGQLWIGTLAADRAASTLKLVRDYDVPRRALYIDTKRDLLFAFVSDPRQKETNDLELEDAKSYDDKASEILDGAGQPQPNEIPDEMEETKRRAADKSRRRLYQFVVIDLKAERANAPGCAVSEEETCAFPYRTNDDPVVIAEQRWIHFKLNNWDGTPDGSTEASNPKFKYYRTNFWEAKADPTDPDAFYVSHRGRPDRSPHANQIVRVRIIDDPRAGLPTEQFLTFERVYGFKGQGISTVGTTLVDNFKYHFPGDFEITEVNGQKLLVVNHFRDLSNWNKGDQYFSLGAQVLDDPTWFTEIRGASTKGDVTTYYQIAVTKDGRALTGSFYGNAVILLQVTPGLGMEVLKRIE